MERTAARALLGFAATIGGLVASVGIALFVYFVMALTAFTEFSYSPHPLSQVAPSTLAMIGVSTVAFCSIIGVYLALTWQDNRRVYTPAKEVIKNPWYEDRQSFRTVIKNPWYEDKHDRPDVYCSVCGGDLSTFSSGSVTLYPGLVCRRCDERAVNSDGDEPYHNSEVDGGDNPIFIDDSLVKTRFEEVPAI